MLKSSILFYYMNQGNSHRKTFFMQRVYCAGITLSLAILLSACGSGSNPDFMVLPNLPEPREPHEATFYRGDRDTVLRYLRDVLREQPIERYTGQPRLRVGEEFTEPHIAQIREVVDELNPLLPLENQIQFDPNSRVTAEDRAGAGEIFLRVTECIGCFAGDTLVLKDLAQPGEAAATFGVEI